MARMFPAGIILFVFQTLAAQTNQVPTINQPLIPPSVTPGSAALILTVNGSGFTAGSVVNWDGVALQTSFTGSGQLTATIPSSNLVTAQTASVTVSTPSPGGGLSNSLPFNVAIPVSAVALSTTLNIVGVNPTVALISADVNNDGKSDLIVLGSSSNACGSEFGAISILLGSGHGTFTTKTTICTYGNIPFAAVARDFNGDGKIDLAVISHNGSKTCGGAGCAAFATYLGDGHGNFVQNQNQVVDGDFYAIAAGDFNGDGKLDLVVSFQIDDNFGGHTTAIFAGNGDGSFNFTQIGLTGIDVPFSSTAFAVGDFDNDGIVDIASVGGGGEYLGNQLGPVTIFLEGVPAATQPNVSLVNPSSVATADFNGDGNLDLVIADSGADTFTILMGAGNGSFSPQTPQPTLPVGSTLIGVADLNDDGFLDLIFSSPPSTITAFLGEGDGNFDLAFANSTASAQFGSGPLADFSSDGRSDIALPNSSNTFYLLRQILTPRSLGVALSPSADPTYIGQPVTLTATVIAAPFFPTGNVSFQQGNTVLGTAPLVKGMATLTFSEAKAGIYRVVAHYSGDENYPAKNSNINTQIVDKSSSSITFGSAPQSSPAGEPVSFFVLVGCSQNPTGRVNFSEGNTALGSAPVVNGRATLTSSAFPVGQYNVVANYSGSAVCDVSTETSLWQLNIF